MSFASLIPWALSAFGAASSLSGSRAEGDRLEAQAVAQEYTAVETELAGRSQAASIRAQADDIIGSTVSAAAGSGVVVSTGSVLDVIEESAYNIELDALTIESDAKRTAEAQRKGAQSSRDAKPSGVSTLLGAFGSAAAGYSQGLQING